MQSLPAVVSRFGLLEKSVKSADYNLVTMHRLLVKGGSTIVLFAPESVVQKNGAVLQGAVSSDLGLVWNKDGVARLFGSQQADALNFYKAPSSLVLVTADRFVRPSQIASTSTQSFPANFYSLF